MFKEPAFQKLHEILDCLETEFNISFLVEHKQESVTSEEVVKTIVDQLEGQNDLVMFSELLGAPKS